MHCVRPITACAHIAASCWISSSVAWLACGSTTATISLAAMSWLWVRWSTRGWLTACGTWAACWHAWRRTAHASGLSCMRTMDRHGHFAVPQMMSGWAGISRGGYTVHGCVGHACVVVRHAVGYWDHEWQTWICLYRDVQAQRCVCCPCLYLAASI